MWMSARDLCSYKCVTKPDLMLNSQLPKPKVVKTDVALALVMPLCNTWVVQPIVLAVTRCSKLLLHAWKIVVFDAVADGLVTDSSSCVPLLKRQRQYL